MPKVLISDKLGQRAVDIFETRGVDVDFRPGLDAAALIACIGDYDGLAIRSATKVTAEVLDAATNLKVVGRAGIGVDNVDLPAATQRGVVVMNTPFGNSITTAEHARSEEHTSELQSLMRISYAVFCLKKKKDTEKTQQDHGQEIQ